MGAGSIGCFVGGMLAAGASTTFVGRPRIVEDLRTHGLTVHPLGGERRHLAVEQLTVSTDPAAVAGCDVVLVCVKSGAVAEAAEQIATHLRPDAVVVSLQNGLRSAEVLRTHLPTVVLAGLVSFNVAETAPGTFVQGTSGGIFVQDDPSAAPLGRVAAQVGLALSLRTDIADLQRGKLLLNMNNAINALSGLPLRDQLAQRGYRLVLAACQREALAVYRAHGVRATRLTPVPYPVMRAVERAPDRVFPVLARQMLQVDPQARSSMADDFRLGRPSEIDQLQGEIVALGLDAGVPTPVCAAVVRLVHQAELEAAQGRPVRRWSAAALAASTLPARRSVLSRRRRGDAPAG